MSIWPAGGVYPPPPRSRSRSPYAQRAPYPDAAYNDPYRNDWETYERERGYGDRYDYAGRRGRSRSPLVEEYPRKRRRSFSPYERGGRYEPRRRYEDEPGFGHSPPRGRNNRRAAPPDPYTLDYPASLKVYADWFRYNNPQEAMEEDAADKAAEHEAGDGSKPRNGIKSKWEKYKKDFAAIQLQTMFNHHRKSPWFAEKYSPAEEFQNLRSKTRKEGWKGRVHAFLDDLEAGKFDPLPETNELEEPSKDSNGSANGAMEDSKAQPNDEDMDGVDDDGETARQDPNRKSNGKQSDSELEVYPEANQVLIRTIPPDIGRVKLENACSKIPGYVYLALGDPLQKRNYYRAGWLRFHEDADMEAVLAELSEKKLDGFKLHVTHNNRAFVGRVRFAPEVASKPERLAKDLDNAKALVNVLEEQEEQLRKMKIISQPENGDGDPDTVMDAPDKVDEEEELPEKGSEAVARRIEKVMADLHDQNLVDASDEIAYETQKTTVALDLYLAYLRAAYHTCYYCAVVTDHVEELHRKCCKHVRKPLSKAASEEVSVPVPGSSAEGESAADDPEDQIASGEKEKDVKKDSRDGRDWKRNDERWLENLDSKIALLLNRDDVNPRDYGGKTYDEELKKATEPHFKQEDDAKFRCKNCMKLFKASSFVEKHIVNKHPHLVPDFEEELQYFNNFALDPHRIQPFSHLPPAVGNTTVPPQAYGIQGSASSSHSAGFHGDRYTPQHNNYMPREEATMARRLSDRISGYPDGSSLPVNTSLPAKPPASALDSALSSGNPRGGTRGGRGNGVVGPPPPPPANVKEDPRAAANRRVSYHDMDLVAEGDVELSY